MKKTLPFIAAAAILLLVSCKPEKPEDVLAAYLENANHGEFEKAAEYADKKSANVLAFIGNMTPANEKLKMMQQNVNVEVTSADIKDTVAYLKAKLIVDGKNGTESSFTLTKEEGDWKVMMGEKFDKLRETAQTTKNDSIPSYQTKDSIK